MVGARELNGSTRPAAARTNGAHDPGSLVSVTGAIYFPLALIARFPYAMMVVGTLTLVVAGRGSLSLGGLTSAMVGLGTACFAPLIGAAADRWGQRRVLLAAGAVNSVALLLVTAAVFSTLGGWAVLSAAFVVGATAPQVAPMSRSRLVGIIGRRLPLARRQKVLNGTMAYESAADEVTFVFGPVIVGLLAATLGPAAPILGAAVLTIVFVSAFALHRSAEEVPRNSTSSSPPAPVSELVTPRLLIVILGVLGVGFMFGATLTSVTSFMQDAGHAERAGLVYAALGVGSAVFALAAALFPEGFTLRARWLVFSGVILTGGIALQFAQTVPVLLLALAVVGIGIGPTLVTLFSLTAALSPRGRSATAMSLATTGIVVGQSAATAVAGHVGESAGTPAAMTVALAAGVVIVVAGTLYGALVMRDRSLPGP